MITRRDYEHINDYDNNSIQNSSFNFFQLSKQFKPLLHGQYISLLISGTGFFASLLSNKNSNCPILLSQLNYFLLISYFIRLYFLQNNNNNNQISENSNSNNNSNNNNNNNNEDINQINENNENNNRNKNKYYDSNNQIFSYFNIQLSQPFWIYFIIGLIDVEANIIVNSAYNYTTITSIMLLDCFSIPCVMILSILFLQAKFNQKHIIGVVICLIGMGCIIFTDVYFISSSDSDNKPSDPLKGDILCLMGTFLYATSNVIQEKLVKTNNRMEFLGMLGINGFIIATIQFFIMELKRFQSIVWSYDIILYTIGYVLCLFLMYSNTSSFLSNNDSTLFNLSLLTSDIYAVLFSYLVFHNLVHWMYFVSFILTVTGLLIYYKGGITTSVESVQRNSFINETINNIFLRNNDRLNEVDCDIDEKLTI